MGNLRQQCLEHYQSLFRRDKGKDKWNLSAKISIRPRSV